MQRICAQAWRGRIESVTCQFGLMSFPPAERAVAEMLRALRPGGRAACLRDGVRSAAPAQIATITK